MIRPGIRRRVGRLRPSAVLAASALAAATLVITPSATQAYSAPTAPSYSFYVDYTWGQAVTFNGINTINAYKHGFESQFGSNPSGTPPKLIVDFRRQKQNSSGVWGVGVGPNGFGSDAWVTNVANAFNEGLNDGHPYQDFWVGYGVNNDTGWTCSSSLWATSGTAWHNTFGGVALPADGWMFMANDFESWWTGSGWASCGAAAINWENAEAVAYSPSGLRLLVANFGSDAHAEYSPTWTLDQVWQVSWNLDEAIVLPEIYVPAKPPSGLG
jgi:hypothetical protein